MNILYNSSTRHLNSSLSVSFLSKCLVPFVSVFFVSEGGDLIADETVLLLFGEVIDLEDAASLVGRIRPWENSLKKNKNNILSTFI